MIFTWSFWAFHDIPGLGKYAFSCSVSRKFYPNKKKFTLDLTHKKFEKITQCFKKENEACYIFFMQLDLDEGNRFERDLNRDNMLKDWNFHRAESIL